MKNKTTLTIIMGIMFSLVLISTVSALTIDSVQTSKDSIQPGDRFSVEIEIENNLDVDAEDVVVSLDLSSGAFAPYESSNQLMKDEIEEDESKTFIFELIADADADSGTYKIPVSIVYKEGDENKTSSGLISLILNAQPELKVSLEDVVLIKGQTKEISVRVVNSGLGEAKLLGLKIIPLSGLKVIGTDSVYIGNIESDDFDSADFKISVNKDATSAVSLPVEISYRDSRNKEFSETKYLSLRTYTFDEAVELGLASKSNTLTYVIVIIVLFVLWLIYRRWKKARKRRD